jgi:predicted nucleotidyltransferase
MKNLTFDKLSTYFQSNPQIILAIIFGSQVIGKPRQDSDYNLAILIQQKDVYKRLGIKGTIRLQPQAYQFFI